MEKLYWIIVLLTSFLTPDLIRAQDLELCANDSIYTYNLNEVVVTVRQPDAVVSADKISFNPASSVAGSTGCIFDVLNSIGGITVDNKGEIWINGQKEISLMINGRKSILTSDALVNYLKSEPARTIERVEIISAPSAKNDAASSSMILNLITSKKRDQGASGGFNVTGLGWMAKRGTANIFGGYSSDRLILNANYSFIANKNPFKLYTMRPYLDMENKMKQEYQRNRRDRIHNISATLDYEVSPAWNAGIAISSNWFNRHEFAKMNNHIISLSTQTSSSNDMVSHYRNIIGNAFIKHKFANQNGILNLGLDYFNYRTNDVQNMMSGTSSSIYGEMGGTSTGYIVSFDFLRKALGRWDISAGAKTSQIFIDNNGLYDGLLPEDIAAADQLNSSFHYHENVNAVYAEGTLSMNKFRISVGMRAEQTNVKSTFSGNEANNKDKYSRHNIQIIPSTNFFMQINENDNLMVGYNQRINRPNYTDLNPFIYIFDDITHTCGNINLQPSLSHNVVTAFSHSSWLRALFNLSLNKDAIIKCYREISDKILYISPENIQDHIQVSLTLSAFNIRLFKWWHTSLNITGMYNKYCFADNMNIRNNHLITPFIDCKNRFSLPHGWAIEFSGEWRGQMAYGQAILKPMGFVNGGIKKSFWDGLGYVSLFVNDVFNSKRLETEIELSGKRGFLSEYDYETMRQVGVSFGLNFSSKRFRASKSSNHILIDEIKRVNL